MSSNSLSEIARFLTSSSSIAPVTATMHHNELLKQFVENMPLGVVIADSEGTFLITSKKLRDIWESYTGKNDWGTGALQDSEIYSNDGNPMTKEDWPLYVTIKTCETVKKILKLKLNHRWVYADVTSTPMCGEDGKLIYVFVFVEDITEKVQQEEQIAFARVQTDFLAHMSHELRTPMHGILGMLDFFNPTSAEQEHDLGVLKRSGEDLLRTLNDILDYTKIDANHIEVESIPFNIHHMVEDLVCIFSSKCPEFVVNIDPSLPENIIGDAYLIKQCLNNLVNNAIKFVRPGCVPRVSMEIKVHKSEVLFIIRDEGIGMSPDTLSKIFRPFMQANSGITRTYGGTGLGLTNVKRLANKMGGEVSVESVVDKGSTFVMSLPLKCVEPEKPESPPAKRRKVCNSPEERKKNAKIRLLLAEDNPINKVVTTSLLRKHGFMVDAVENGIEVLERIEADSTYDLLLLDIQMPKMGGHETCKILRKRRWDKPIIALTASAMESDRRKCLDVGMNDYMSKPFKMEELEPKIRSLVCKVDSPDLTPLQIVSLPTPVFISL